MNAADDGDRRHGEGERDEASSPARVGDATADDQSDAGGRADGDREQADHPAAEPLHVGEVAVLEEARRRDEDVADERHRGQQAAGGGGSSAADAWSA